MSYRTTQNQASAEFILVVACIAMIAIILCLAVYNAMQPPAKPHPMPHGPYPEQIADTTKPDIIVDKPQ